MNDMTDQPNETPDDLKEAAVDEVPGPETETAPVEETADANESEASAMIAITDKYAFKNYTGMLISVGGVTLPKLGTATLHHKMQQKWQVPTDDNEQIVYQCTHSNVQGLPEPEPNVLYVVNYDIWLMNQLMLASEQKRHRTDLVFALKKTPGSRDAEYVIATI
jgi:hypothetical protein